MSQQPNISFGQVKLPQPVKKIRLGPPVPPVPHVPQNKLLSEGKTLWEKIKDMDKLVSWIIMAAILAFPFTLLLNTLLYWYIEVYREEEFFGFSGDDDLQLVWAAFTYIICLIGFLLCRAGAATYTYIKDQAYFN